jgi:hypothetical protein
MIFVLAGVVLGLAGLVVAALGHAGGFRAVLVATALALVVSSLALALALVRSFAARLGALVLEAQHRARAVPEAGTAEHASDPLTSLALCIGKMSDRMETLTRELEHRCDEERARVDVLVRERTRQLGEEIADLRRWLGPSKAFLSVDAQGNIVGHSSSVIEGWLGSQPERGHFWDYFDRGGAEVASRFEAAWRDMLRGVPSEIDLRRMPTSFAIGDRYVALEYQAVQAADGQLERLLVLLTDISAPAAAPSG